MTNHLDVTLCKGDLDPRHSLGVETGPRLPAPRPTEVDHHLGLGELQLEAEGAGGAVDGFAEPGGLMLNVVGAGEHVHAR